MFDIFEMGGPTCEALSCCERYDDPVGFFSTIFLGRFVFFWSFGCPPMLHMC